MYISKSLSKRLFIFKVKRFATRLLFLGLLATLAHLVYYGIRTTLFNIPFPIVGELTVQHELSLALWVFGSVTCVALMVIILNKARPPHQRTVWHI